MDCEKVLTRSTFVMSVFRVRGREEFELNFTLLFLIETWELATISDDANWDIRAVWNLNSTKKSLTKEHHLNQWRCSMVFFFCKLHKLNVCRRVIEKNVKQTHLQVALPVEWGVKWLSSSSQLVRFSFPPKQRMMIRLNLRRLWTQWKKRRSSYIAIFW